MNPSNDDCYFYYYSTCTKGSECPFRHCEAALGTETVCAAWKNGFCLRKNCKFRHMESKINRTTIACYWENQPGGCRKPHCVFFHQKTKKSGLAEEHALILPMSGQSPQQSPVSKEQSDGNVSLPTGDKNDDLLSPSIPVEPVVVTLNDGEESDTESMTSTPVKLASATPHTMPGIDLFKNTESDDFGIKTLEQLRMEKIHRESAHFYNSVYDAPALESAPVEFNKKSPVYQRDLNENDHSSSMTDYDPPSETIAVANDLRALLKRKQGGKSETHVSSDKDNSKRVISFKRAKKDHDSDSTSLTVTFNKVGKKDAVSAPMDFQIKTLDEIRKEKNKKENTLDHNVVEEDIDEDMEEEEKPETPRVRIASQISRIKRPAREIYQVKSPLKNGKRPLKSDSEQFTDIKKFKSDDSSISKMKTKDAQAKENDAKPSFTSRRILKRKKSVQESDDQGSKESVATKIIGFQRNTIDGFKSFLRHPLTQLERSKNSQVKSIESEEAIETNGIENSTGQLPSKDLSSNGTETIDSPKSSEQTDQQNTNVTRTTSVDEFEQLLLDSDAELDNDDDNADGGEETEDIFLELEEMLKS